MPFGLLNGLVVNTLIVAFGATMIVAWLITWVFFFKPKWPLEGVVPHHKFINAGYLLVAFVLIIFGQINTKSVEPVEPIQLSAGNAANNCSFHLEILEETETDIYLLARVDCDATRADDFIIVPYVFDRSGATYAQTGGGVFLGSETSFSSRFWVSTEEGRGSYPMDVYMQFFSFSDYVAQRIGRTPQGSLPELIDQLSGVGQTAICQLRKQPSTATC